MQNRPYFNYNGDRIKQVFDDNQNDLDILKQLYSELQHRSTLKMKALRAKVEKRIEAFASSSIEGETPLENNPSKHDPRHSQSSNPVQKSLFSDYKPQEDTIKAARSFVSPTSETINSTKQETKKEEPPREARMGKMRKPGKLDGVPSKRQFDLKDDIKLEIKKDAPLAVRYETGLKSLVAEMRRKKTAFKQIVLESGIRVQLDGKENGYQFPYNDDAELFEGAAVVAIIGGTQSEGRIVAFLGNQIVISLQNDFGPRINTHTNICQAPTFSSKNFPS